MLDFLKNWSLDLVTLVIFITLIEIIIPTGKFKKYVNLVTGLVLVIAIVTPITGLFRKDIRLLDFQVRNTAYLDRKDIEKRSEYTRDEQMKSIVESYKKKLTDEVKRQVEQVMKGQGDYRVEVEINEDYKDSNFGEIKRVMLEIGSDPRQGSVTAVKIDRIAMGNKKETEPQLMGGEVDEAAGKAVKSKIAGLFEISEDKIFLYKKSNER